MTEGLASLRETLGHAFADASILTTALTHSSWVHENGGDDYERLEFLGDAVLQVCTTRLLFTHVPRAREGELSRMRARLVSTHALAALGRRLAIGPALRLGVGEEATGGRDRPRVLAGAVEAVLGALFVDGGFEVASGTVTEWLREPLRELAAEGPGAWKDPRSRLQERTQAAEGATPTYAVTQRGGPAHDPTFVVEVRLGDRVLGEGEGSSKREAARRAAETALADPDPSDDGPDVD
ncbi:MAG: ribonuclease III [Myxococcota bacterium]